MAIIAQLYSLDASSEVEIKDVIGLRETPAPGDVISLKDGKSVRVLRRTFNELQGDDQVDVVLGVRLV